MKRQLIGALAMTALLCAGGAFAHDKAIRDEHSMKKGDTSSYGKGGSGTTGTSGTSDVPKADTSTGSSSTGSTDTYGKSDQSADSTSLQGEVVKFSGNMLWLRHMGAVVPIKIDKSTQFDGSDRSSIKEGITLSLEVKVVNKTQNLATRIGSSDLGRGGSGVDSAPFPDLNQGTIRNTPPIEHSPGSPLPEEPGTQPRTPTNPNDRSY
jgi:hypothetical protein